MAEDLNAEDGAVGQSKKTVMPGLDPGIHAAARRNAGRASCGSMDCRVKPGNDGCKM
jgi:hypothetical protein